MSELSKPRILPHFQNPGVMQSNLGLTKIPVSTPEAGTAAANHVLNDALLSSLESEAREVEAKSKEVVKKLVDECTLLWKLLEKISKEEMLSVVARQTTNAVLNNSLTTLGTSQRLEQLEIAATKCLVVLERMNVEADQDLVKFLNKLLIK